MSDKPPPMPPPSMETWNISSRLVLGTMVAFLIILAGALKLSQHRYRATIEPTTHPRVHRFPAPALDGFGNPAHPAPALRPAPPLSNAALAAAAAAASPLPFRGEGWERGSHTTTAASSSLSPDASK